jgi:branched-chain amino acid transport system substrate-binding protein/urea transport system substrate-binding protein
MVTRRDVIIGAGAVGAATAAAGFPAIAEQGPFRIGVFVSEADRYQPDQFGEMVEPYVSQLRLGLELAASEINAAGGLIGRRIEFAYVDDGGSPPARAAVLGLIDHAGVEAIVIGFVQAAPRLITTHIGPENPVPVLHGFWVDGSYCGPLAKHFGPTIRQVVPSIRPDIDGVAAERPFTISTWTPSGRAVSEYLYQALGHPHTGDALVTTPYPGNHPGEYRGVIRWATDMESRVIWTADPRPYAVNVVNQAVELGVADGKVFAYVDFSEWQADQLRPGASIITCLPFVASDPADGVHDFVARARAMSSGGLVTHVAFTHYNAIMALQAAIERSGDATAADALAGFKDGLTLETATGPLMLEPGGYSTMQMFVATAEGGGGLQIVERLDAVPSGATC